MASRHRRLVADTMNTRVNTQKGFLTISSHFTRMKTGGPFFLLLLILLSCAKPYLMVFRTTRRFKEKYHPEVLEKRKQDLAALVQKNYSTFITDYEEGNIDANSVETELYYEEEASMFSKNR